MLSLGGKIDNKPTLKRVAHYAPSPVRTTASDSRHKGLLLVVLLYAAAFDDDLHEERIRRRQRRYEGGQAHHEAVSLLSRRAPAILIKLLKCRGIDVIATRVSSKRAGSTAVHIRRSHRSSSSSSHCVLNGIVIALRIFSLFWSLRYRPILTLLQPNLQDMRSMHPLGSMQDMRSHSTRELHMLDVMIL
jgi:hypothetical protein